MLSGKVARTIVKNTIVEVSLSPAGTLLTSSLKSTPARYAPHPEESLAASVRRQFRRAYSDLDSPMTKQVQDLLGTCPDLAGSSSPDSSRSFDGRAAIRRRPDPLSRFMDFKWGRKLYHNGPMSLDDTLHVAIVTPLIHDGMGGVKVNDGAEVLGENDEVIPGLLVAGEAMGGVHGKSPWALYTAQRKQMLTL